MIQSYFKSTIKFYQLSLILMAFAILGTLGYFWKMGMLDGSRAKNLHQMSYILESYESKPQLNNVRELVQIQDYKLAIRKIKEIEKDFEKVNRTIKTQQFDKLHKEFQNLKTSTANLLSFPKTTKVLSVFNTKMDKFYDYVRENKWRTLTRMSERIYSITRSEINVSRIPNIVGSINKDFNSMIQLTENSILARKDKSEIVSRIKNLQTEMEMLKKYSDEVKSFNQLYGDADNAVKAWFLAVSPELTLQKIQVEQVGKLFIMGLGGLFGFALLLFVAGHMVMRWRRPREQKLFEKDMELIIGERIVEAQNVDLLSATSNEFQDYCETMSRYVNKRMSMGSIFQDALPLASVLLDENLQVIWSNRQFCEDWHLDEEEMNKDYMSWDFLSKLTNLGQDDPVIEGLKHGVAGIYQVQVKPNEDLTARPYEMYVSPVSYHDQKRVQLFFYDLRSLEQTIKDQAQGLITPIKAALKRIRQDEFEANEETKQEFMLAGIKDVYQSFVENHQKLMNEKENLMDQIEITSAEVERLKHEQAFVKEKLEGSLDVNKSNLKSLKVFKDNVIGLSAQARELDRSYKKALEVINTNISALVTNKNRVDTLSNVLNEIISSVPQYVHMKADIKQAKSQVCESLNRLSQMMKSKGMDTSDAFAQVKMASQELDKRLSQMEVLLSKADMIMNSSRSQLENWQGNYEAGQIQFAQNEMKVFKRLELEALDQIDTNEQQIIESLQGLFEGTKTQFKLEVDAHSHL